MKNGKSDPADLASAIIGAVESVTGRWARQRKAEERHASAELNRAYRMTRWRDDRVTVRDAAWDVMADAYMAASDNNRLPANARQIMYAARPEILTLSEKDSLNDQYFTQTLLPDYIAENPEECADWDVVYDARGTFTEPHTGRDVPLGTIEVRQYLGDRPEFGQSPSLGPQTTILAPTAGAKNRYKNVLFLEKEGFDPLLQAAQIAERFDVAIMSTKGMSTTAARNLLDRLTPDIEQVLVLHDFDIAGFSILGTLGEHSRRYIFDNDVQLVDIGLRLGDVETLGLQSEPMAVKDWFARQRTLRRHGATPAEIEFLRTRRVELNAMTSRQFVDLLERKFAEHRVTKLIPEGNVLESHWHRLLTERLADAAFEKIRAGVAKEAAETAAPENLVERVADHLQRHPEVPWDGALAHLARDETDKPN